METLTVSRSATLSYVYRRMPGGWTVQTVRRLPNGRYRRSTLRYIGTLPSDLAHPHH